ncbi:aldo/keto reductase [Rhizobium halophytocola]|uniref:Diketogulonate reductase-like aldo/keto reductase n=1 Tax=Rhizobium halophytocola TaxID=735519 RepID=A0ABS4DX10_9HYPH|nr:aldo/keto reductase [Rhizobium halophytocola]MBP1850205.1 diketogulonate reductase-like aldo/keto reductase [Rhizobium halophytocola]
MDTVNAHGAEIPALGFGTFRMSEPDVAHILPLALKVGFRHVDTAQAYRNEEAVGSAIRQSGVGRDEIFLTTKVWVDNFAEDEFIPSVEESLKKLQTDHVDLLLLHWPKSDVPLEVQIQCLNRLVEQGKVKHIGVSNYSTALMGQAVELSRAPIVTNQIEYHPYLDQHVVLQAANSYGMAVTAYYVMADGKVPREPLLQDIGARYGKTAAQVALRWALQQPGVTALSKTATESRLAENFAVMDFLLSGEEVAAINALARPDGRIINPAHLAPDWD